MVTKTILAEHFPEKREFKHKGRGKKTSNVVTISDRADLGAVETEDAENPEQTDPHMPLVKSLQSGSFYIYKLLEEFKPRYVILYDVEMSVVRQLEVFQARQPDFKVLLWTSQIWIFFCVYFGDDIITYLEYDYFQVKVYFLVYSNSVEEQAYLTSLRREKEAFEFLIKEKGSLVLPETYEEFDEPEIYGAKNNLVTRKGGGAVPT